MNKYINKDLLPEEVKEYLKQDLELRRQQFLENLNKYLNTLSDEDKNKAINEIYNWNINEN